MKIVYNILIIFFSIILVSCGGDNEDPKITPFKKKPVFKITVNNNIKKVDATDLYIDKKDGDNAIYLKFNLEQAKEVTGDNWDVAFCRRSIIVNGGNQVITDKAYADLIEPERTGNAALAIVGKIDAKEENLVAIASEDGGDYLKTTEVPENIEFRQDKLGEFAIKLDKSRILSEYNATPIKVGEHIVSIRNNCFLIIRTHNGHYAKLKIKSLYSNGGKDYKKAKSWEDSYNYFPYLTFTYNYNMTKGDKRLE